MTPDFSSFAARLRAFNGSALDLERGTRNEDSTHTDTDSSDVSFNSLALELFALQFAHNSPYRRFCEAVRVLPQGITDWKHIPAMPTAAFKELALSCLPPEARTTVFHSSGTTEHRPGRHYHNAESLAIYEASLLPWFRAHVLADDPLATGEWRLVILTPPLAQATQSSLVHMLETVRREFGAADSAFVARASNNAEWALDVNAVLKILREACVSHRPLVLLGTAFLFVHLLDALMEQNLRFELPAGSRLMETGGYKGRSRTLPKEELHALITERLGIPETHIICEYGMSELSSQAYDGRVSAREPRVSRFPPWARAQIVSPETGRDVTEGETGLIRVFDLANVFSVMAVQTEDLGIRRGEGFEMIGRVAAAEPRGCSLMTA